MKKLDFIEGHPPAGFKADFDQYLFNTSEHLELQASKWISFHVILHEKKRIHASLHVHVEKDVAESPFKAPFGSISFSEKLLPEQLNEFIDFVEARLRKKGVTRIVLRNPPEAYQPERAVILSVMLMNAGYGVIRSEINSSIVVSKKTFQEGIDSSESRKLKQGRKAKLKARQLSLDQLTDVYSFLLACREERGQSLSMTLKEITRIVKALPKAFILFGVYNQNELVAASIAIHVNKNILYNFYPGHSRQFDSISPAVLMTEAIYAFCQKEHISILDLGTSSLAGKPNFGLLNFKLRIGGIPSVRLTYAKDL